MNKVILTGRLTAAPDLRTTTTGKSVTEFTLAVDRFTDGEKQADFIRCVAWNKQAENLCRYQTKGDKIAVFGAWRVEKYKDNNGNEKYKNYVLVSELEFLSSKTKKDDVTAAEKAAEKAAADIVENAAEYMDDDLPF